MPEPIKLYSVPGRDVAGFSHEGVSYAPDETGAFLVPEEALEVAMLHGLTTAAPEPPAGQVPPPQDPGQHVPPGPTLQEMMDAQRNKADLAEWAREAYGLELDPDAMKRDEMEAAILAKDAEE